MQPVLVLLGKVCAVHTVQLELNVSCNSKNGFSPRKAWYCFVCVCVFPKIVGTICKRHFSAGKQTFCTPVCLFPGRISPFRPKTVVQNRRQLSAVVISYFQVNSRYTCMYWKSNSHLGIGFFLFFFFKFTFVYYFNQLVVIIQSPELDCTPVFPESVKINTVEDSSVKWLSTPRWCSGWNIWGIFFFLPILPSRSICALRR